MAAIIDISPARLTRPRNATSDSLASRLLIIGTAVGFMGLMFVLPLVVIFKEAFRKGWEGFIEAFDDGATMHAIWLTLKVAAITVPLNTLFGLAAAWCVSRFQFRGKRFLTSLIELPLWVSPIIAGMVFVLLFGAQGLFGPTLKEHGIKIIFALSGIVLSTIFVTFTFVARILAPQMEAQGQAEEEAAMTLGANGFQMFWRVTLPKIKWGLLYGIILCNARSMGEFGAVSVVSGHIRNKTNTVPLHIEVLYNEYQFVPAFAVASVLALLALVTLILKTLTTTQRGAA
ncbi:MAG: sulfate ABC transporter permease subunit CysW [Verrucomicrobia bacterium 12-59-8]|nr:MAG: sulfate ABC transporter permease subunit CysW [Verrucomicrobia bacterium 12-59-8]